MIILLKTMLVRVSSVQIMQDRVQNKVKVFGKVDTMKAYHALPYVTVDGCSTTALSQQ